MATRPLKTWSALEGLKRVPSEYEVVTHDLHYHTKMPFELDPSTPVVAWYRKYRDEMALRGVPWEQFRDPERMIYRKYTEGRDDRETFIDVLYEEWDETPARQNGPTPWIHYLCDVFGVLRYPAHALQMVAAYGAQLAPTSYITNCFIFLAADQMRRVQRTAYHLAVLREVYPALPWAVGDVERWEQDPRWRGLRELVERLLVTYPWDESWAALTLVVGPVLDRLWNVHFAELAHLNEDPILPELLGNLHLDGLWHQAWSQELAHLAVGAGAEAKATLERYVRQWGDATFEALATLAPLFETDPPRPIPFAAVMKDIRQQQQAWWDTVGLRVR